MEAEQKEREREGKGKFRSNFGPPRSPHNVVFSRFLCGMSEVVEKESQETALSKASLEE